MPSRNSNAGRKKGSFNKLTTEVKETLWKLLKSEYKQLKKYFSHVEMERRPSYLIKFLPFLLSKTGTKEEKEVQDIVYEELKPHYRKLRFYLNQVPKDKMPALLLRYLKELSPKQKAEVTEIIEEEIKKRA